MKKHLVIIGLVVPEPASTAAGHRMLQLMNVFEEIGYHITFLTSSNPTEFSSRINVISININDSSFDEQLKELCPDVVLFDRYISEEQFGWRVAEVCPQAMRILDTEDLHFLRSARGKAFKEKREVLESDYYNDTFKREIASILRCDLSLIISKFEYDLLINQFNINTDLLFYIPFLNKNISKEVASFNERQHFVSIGNFLHEPNWQTVLQLKSIWKDIRKALPKAEMHIYGGYAKEKVYQLHDEKSGFLIKGRAESVPELFNSAKVLLAPIPFGAGLKGKLWESMLLGLPNVTTFVGAEGMYDDKNDWNGFIIDDLDSFVLSAIELYQNEEKWLESQEKGFVLAEKLFHYDLFFDSFKNVIASLEINLENHRQKNYLGQILHHHSLNSTKYMSRWIEEKNKKTSN